MIRRKEKHSLANLADVTRISISDRPSKTKVEAFARPISKDATISEFMLSLPKFLKASDLNELIAIIAEARKNDKPFHLLLGAHTIKVGLSPIVIDLMRQGIVTGLSFNGAGVIHDLELAFFGGTSEDVAAGLRDGSFGMVTETSELYSKVTKLASDNEIGLGEACGNLIMEESAPYSSVSVFASAYDLGLPVTVHVGIGTDIVSQHPEFDGAAVGAASHRDFRLLASICSEIDSGGVVANIGSAVILPEVFLKALTVARNLSKGKSQLTTANFDMIEHYRPLMNIVNRPTLDSGRGFSFVGHHEIMIPLLACGLKQACGNQNSK